MNVKQLSNLELAEELAFWVHTEVPEKFKTCEQYLSLTKEISLRLTKPPEKPAKASRNCNCVFEQGETRYFVNGLCARCSKPYRGK
jgi:hypothetical protein